MRILTKRMRESAAEAEENKVEVRRDDKTIRPFKILTPENLSGEILAISSFTTIKNHKPKTHAAKISLRKNQHVLLHWAEWNQQSTLRIIGEWRAEGAKIMAGVKVDYYRQGFQPDFEETRCMNL